MEIVTEDETRWKYSGFTGMNAALFWLMENGYDTTVTGVITEVAVDKKGEIKRVLTKNVL